ncbi:hypothetical protein JTE90_006845 [Oedothorax gibbosus]|uniref:Amidase domain-containing protein n=1 Tax=Oedothorax gibbosus TaxID=931172 RepID=A0AAV6TU84_9ARAC|nr:hypothetical protein JTE90_006845 [Oedothorax gibbosus]
MKLFWRCFSVLHRLFDIILHGLFRLAYAGRKEQLPPISNLLLLQSATSLAAKIRKKKLKSVDLVNVYIQRIKEVNPFLNAAVHFRFDQALNEAQKADEIVAKGAKTEEELEKEMPFLGVPISVKELIAVEGLPLSGGLVSRKDARSPFNAQTVQLMRSAGAIPLVTTNISELGMWYESYNKVYGRTSNAYDTSRTCGGSSGGEGSLLGAAGSVMGIGSDIGGSIRIPAFFNGIFGHKPSPEVVSNYGTYPPSCEREFVPYLSLGPMCRYATDLAPMLSVLAGKGAAMLHLELPVKLKELKVYYIEDFGNHVVCTKVENDMIKALYKVLHHFTNAYKVTPTKLNLPALRHAYPMWAEAIRACRAPAFSEELTERKGGKIDFRAELVKWLLGKSPFTYPAVLLGAIEGTVFDGSGKHLTRLKDLKLQLQELLGEDGILFVPPHPTVAPHHNEPLFKPFNFSYTGIFNVLGFPVTQCPLGIGNEGLPLGVQVAAAPGCDRLTLAVAVELEKVFGGWVCPSAVME